MKFIAISIFLALLGCCMAQTLSAQDTLGKDAYILFEESAYCRYSDSTYTYRMPNYSWGHTFWPKSGTTADTIQLSEGIDIKTPFWVATFPENHGFSLDAIANKGYSIKLAMGKLGLLYEHIYIVIPYTNKRFFIIQEVEHRRVDICRF